MSVIVKGMKIPKSCNECIMCVDGKYGERCLLTNQYIESIVDSCPLVALPEKHGRLIDGDYLYNRLKALRLKDENVFRIIKEEPTVIESEE